MEACHVLDLDWREIAANPPAAFLNPGERLEPRPLTIDDLVAEVRSQHHDTIQHQCAVLRLLDINHPVNIDDINVNVVNILEAVANQQWPKFNDLNNLELTEFDRVG